MAEFVHWFEAQTSALGAPHYRIARCAPDRFVSCSFEIIAERSPPVISSQRMHDALPNADRLIYRLMKRELDYDSERAGAWARAYEINILEDYVIKSAGMSSFIVSPCFGMRGLLGYAILFLPQPVTDILKREALVHLARVGANRAIEIARGGDGEPPSPLTDRQREALAHCAEGKSDWDIGLLMGVSPTTAHGHIEAAKRKIGVKTRVQAAVRAVQLGWLFP